MGEVVVSLSELEQRLVAPFYLPMMGVGATDLEPELLDELVRVSATVTLDEVRRLLGSGWRPLVVGTWLALAMPGDEIKDGVVTAMTSSAGGLTAPPLAAVSALLAGVEAISAMQTYVEWIGDPARRDGSYEVVAAAITHLGGTRRLSLRRLLLFLPSESCTSVLASCVPGCPGRDDAALIDDDGEPGWECGDPRPRPCVAAGCRCGSRGVGRAAG
ncbi:hypothetical protein [Promicromonospora sp. NPDC090134]|uniref:hypothetical protein n=1 Tax=Promicromonospora sp. NPDC090134 TaxID=3364408 RepID=UPI003810836B